MAGAWDPRPAASREATFDEGKPVLDASRVGLLAALIAEAWPEISALSIDKFEAMPEVVRRLLADFWNAGTTRMLPHQAAIEDARADATSAREALARVVARRKTRTEQSA